MNELMHSILQLCLGLFITTIAIAASSIGIQYYNKCQKLQEDSKMTRNRDFLIFLLAAALLGIGGMITSFILKHKKTVTPNVALNNKLK